MAVYVDEIRTWTTRPPFHGGACHLTADTLEELHDLAKRIGLSRGWYQPLSSPHYDLTPAKRKQALAAGAVEVSGKEQARKRVDARRAAIGGGR